MLNRAKAWLKAQIEKTTMRRGAPSIWPKLCLYTNSPEGFLEYIAQGLEICTARWQPETLRRSLELLPDVGIRLPGLDAGIARLEEAEAFLPD